MTGQDDTIRPDALTDEQIQRVINSRGFQKMLAYQRLADGIDVLEERGELFESMVHSITKQHSNISTEDSVREVLDLFVDEVQTFTEPLVEDVGGADALAVEELEDLNAG